MIFSGRWLFNRWAFYGDFMGFMRPAGSRARRMHRRGLEQVEQPLDPFRRQFADSFKSFIDDIGHCGKLPETA